MLLIEFTVSAWVLVQNRLVIMEKKNAFALIPMMKIWLAGFHVDSVGNNQTLKCSERCSSKNEFYCLSLQFIHFWILLVDRTLFYVKKKSQYFFPSCFIPL